MVTQAGLEKKHITDVSHGGEEGNGTPGGPLLWTLFAMLPPERITLPADGCEEAAALGAATLAAHHIQPDAIESALPGWHPPPDVLPNGVYVLHPDGKTSTLHRALDPLVTDDRPGVRVGGNGASVGCRSHTLRFPRSTSEQRVGIMEGDAEVPITQRCVAELVLQPATRRSWVPRAREPRAVSVWLSADGLLAADVEDDEDEEGEEVASGGGIGKMLLLVLLMSLVASLMARLMSGGPMLHEQPSRAGGT